jgi:hypothetical protein
MIEPPAHWETERLVLRPPTLADAPLAFASLLEIGPRRLVDLASVD